MDRIPDRPEPVNSGQPIQIITLAEDEEGWRWMRLTIGSTFASHALWPVQSDAMDAAIIVADCYDCPFVERFPMRLTPETYQLITSGNPL